VQRALLAAALLLVVHAKLLAGQAAPEDSLRLLLERRIHADGGAVASIYYRDLASGNTLSIDADREYHAASTMKVAVMVQVFRDADAGRLSLSERTRVTNEFRSLADGSIFRLEPGDDSERSLYDQVGREERIEQLMRLMITRSSNLATNILIGLVGAERVTASMRALGAEGMDVRRGVEDGAAFRAGINNTTTARSLGVILAAIANGEAAGARSCGRMLDVLLDTEDREGIFQGLPRRARLAHKTGTITGMRHDAGIVYVQGRPRYVLVVLTRDIPEVAVANRLIADITQLIHEHFTPVAR
jgi:beta-lactamase class A